MTLYEALEERSSYLASVTDAVPAFAVLIRSLAIAAARWSEKSRQDVQSAHLLAFPADDETFVMRLRARESVVPIFRNVIVTSFETAARFLHANQDVPPVLELLAKWALERIEKGAVSFETRWSPDSDGFIAVTAINRPANS